MKIGLLFAGGGPLDYGRRLSRRLWRRAFTGSTPRDGSPTEPAERSLSGAEAWIAVRDESAIPLPGARVEPRAGRVVLAASRGAFKTAPPHTLRELEEAVFVPEADADGTEAPALAFLACDFAPAAGEPLGSFLARLCVPPTRREVAPAFAAFAFDDPFERRRPDVVRRVPAGARRLLDVGCGAGTASAALKTDRPGLTVEGVERHPAAAALARKRLDRVHEGEAGAVLRRLVAAGERYDAFLLANVLERLTDPFDLLALAGRLAAPGAALIASVPNVGHVSLTRDLLRGRFDPVPAGLADAGHLRWFTRRSLAEAVEEAGWSVEAVEAAPGAPAEGAEDFLAGLRDFPGLDKESLLAYQWIAVARFSTAPGAEP